MTARATLRKSGKRMFTLHVEHHVDVNELVAMVSTELIDADSRPTSRDEVLVLARNWLRSGGGEATAFIHEGHSDEEWADLRAEAAGIVGALFPELSADLEAR